MGLLIRRGADVNAFGGNHGTALIAACSSSWRAAERLGTVRILVKNGADIHAQGRLGGNAMQAASFNGQAGIVAYLLHKGADADSRGGQYGSALIAACCHGGDEEETMETVKVLITNGANVNYVGEHYGSALYEAAYRGHYNVVRLLIGARADANTWNNPMKAPLMATCRGKEDDMRSAKSILEHGADINASDSFAVTMASMFGSREMVRFLVENGASLEAAESGFTAMHAAAMYARADIADVLVAFGVDVNSHHYLLGTPLHFACSKEADELIAIDSDEPKMVFDSSIDRNLEDTTPLLLAKVDEIVSGSFCADLVKKRAEKRLALVRLLVEKKADVNARRAGGISVLHDALERDDQGLVDLLIAKGAIDQVGEDSLIERIRVAGLGLLMKIVEAMMPREAEQYRAYTEFLLPHPIYWVALLPLALWFLYL